MAKKESKFQPKEVSDAVYFLYLSLAVGVASIIYNLIKQPELFIFLLFVYIFTFAFMIFFIYMIGKGKNWARITFLVLFIIGMPFTFISWLQAEAIILLISIVQAIMQFVALILLFQRPSTDWFNVMKNEK